MLGTSAYYFLQILGNKFDKESKQFLLQPWRLKLVVNYLIFYGCFFVFCF